jgi:sulfotransferase
LLEVTRFHFISGLPRSGSTLLAAVLAQNPRFRAGMTSPVGSLVHAVLGQVTAGSEFAQTVSTAQRRRLLRGLFDSFYGVDDPADAGPAEIVFDTNRHWCSKLPLVLDLFPDARIIACVRNVAWVMDSLETLYRANPYENPKIFGANALRTNVYNRVEGLMQHDQLVGFAWAALREAFYGRHASSLLLVDYDLLVRTPGKVLPLIYDFIGEPAFTHDFDNVEYDASEFDIPLGMPGLHKVRAKIEHRTRRTLLPPDLFEKYDRLSFWNDPSGSAANVIAPR